MKIFKITLLSVFIILCLTACGTSAKKDTDTVDDIKRTEINIYQKENESEKTSTDVNSTTSNKNQSSSSVEVSSDASSNSFNKQPNIDKHIHSFSKVTCTEPSKCSCGEIDGNALGHSFADATCIAARICASCGASEGVALGHLFQNGVCSRCGVNEPNTEDTNMVWIPTKGGSKYHQTSGCSNMIDPQQVTKSEAESQGFTPCKRCY